MGTTYHHLPNLVFSGYEAPPPGMSLTSHPQRLQHQAYGSTMTPSDRSLPPADRANDTFHPMPSFLSHSQQQPSQSRQHPHELGGPLRCSQGSRPYPHGSERQQAPWPSTPAASVPLRGGGSSVTLIRSPQRPSQPSMRTQGQTARPTTGHVLSERDAAMVKSSMRIPPCISPAASGSLADFAGHMTAMFWFESTQVLEVVERMGVGALQGHGGTIRVTESAMACEGFRKWVHSVLSTTQVTQNVVLLSLLFVYRLKMSNPSVKGRTGSEYRLLTVALMLANKFLDDNTYTNKTWAEVSGIAVTEIHVMEVEFLSNMRYNLLVSQDAWEAWLVKLARFFEFHARALQELPVSPASLLIPSRPFASPLSSPTETTAPHSGSQALADMQPMAQPATSRPGHWRMSSYPSTSMSCAFRLGVSSPAAHRLELPRKRNLVEEDPTEPSAKRPSRHFPGHIEAPPVRYGAYSQAPAPAQMVAPQAAEGAAVLRPLAYPASGSVRQRLSVPNLTLNTDHMTFSDGQTSAPQSRPHGFPPAPMSALSLPPLVPGTRAMSTVFAPQLPVSSGAAAGMIPVTASSVLTPTQPFPTMGFGTPTKRLSPQRSLAQNASYAGSPPLTEPLSTHHHSLTPLGNGVHTPISNSPSAYLQQRPSPYKPVRAVNRLLYPPPSAFLHQYHLQSVVPPTQMHYQPIGRRNELRTGVVPEYTMASYPYQIPQQPHTQMTAAVPQQPGPDQLRPMLPPSYVQGMQTMPPRNSTV